MAAMAQSIYMLGCLIASTVLGELADRYFSSRFREGGD